MRRSRLGIGRVLVGQLVLVELVLLGVAISLPAPLWLLIVVSAAGVVLLVAGFGSRAGRWSFERLGMRRRLRRRQKASAGIRAESGPSDRLEVLRTLAPDLSVVDTEQRGSRLGVGSDRSGWFAAARLKGPAGLEVQVDRRNTLLELASLIEDSELPVSAVQWVSHTVPAPICLDETESPCVSSYRALVNDLAGRTLVSGQTSWVVVRIDAETAAEVTAGRGGRADAVPIALSNAINRAVRALSSHGAVFEVLDADGLLEALATSCGFADPPPGVLGYPDGSPQDSSQASRETITSWQTAAEHHVSFWVDRWPDLEAGRSAVPTRLSRLSTAVTDVSICLLAKPDGVDLVGLARISSPAEALPRACAEMQSHAQQAGAGLRRLDGEQAPAVYASAPTAGCLS